MKSSETVKDFAGNDVSIGDLIFWRTAGKRPANYLGLVVKFTPSGKPVIHTLRRKWRGPVVGHREEKVDTICRIPEFVRVYEEW